MIKEPKAIKLYSKHVTQIFDMPRSAQKILGYMLDKMNDDNEITIASGTKTKMLDDLNMKPQTLNNGLLALVKNCVISNPHKGGYIVNPNVFTLKRMWGDTLNSQRSFRATLSYDSDGGFKIGGEWGRS